MSAHDNLSYQLFRGLQGNAIQEPLGTHWSPDKQVAFHFARAGVPAAGKSTHATIVEGLVQPKDTINPKSREGRWITRGFPGEKEIPVKEGAKVLVTKVTKTKLTKSPASLDKMTRIRRRTMKVSYNPPREMKA
jgi:hypothetical protein